MYTQLAQVVAGGPHFTTNTLTVDSRVA